MSDDSVPIRAFIVDAIDDTAREFYARFDFVEYPADSLRMWILMKDLMATLKAAAQKQVSEARVTKETQECYCGQGAARKRIWGSMMVMARVTRIEKTVPVLNNRGPIVLALAPRADRKRISRTQPMV